MNPQLTPEEQKRFLESIDKLFPGFTLEERDAFARSIVRIGKHAPSPMKAGVVCGVGGAALAVLLGKSVLKYGVLGAGAAFLGTTLLESSFLAGYTMGFGAGTLPEAKRTS